MLLFILEPRYIVHKSCDKKIFVSAVEPVSSAIPLIMPVSPGPDLKVYFYCTTCL